jgi:hypothetical protein
MMTMQKTTQRPLQEQRLSGRQYIHDNFQYGAINLDYPAIAALAMIIHATTMYLINK